MGFITYRSFINVSIVFMAMSCGTSKPTVKAVPEIIKVTPQGNKQAIVTTADDIFFETLFKSNGSKFDSIETNKKDWNVQIIYTQINRDKNGNAQLKNYYYNKAGASYFYPASTVKLPIALLALQKLNELKAKGIDRNTTMITQSAYSGQSDVYNDPNTPDGRPTIAQYIKKIFLVSDNDAFNRLYEFLGQEYINTELHKKGFTDVQILHRLNIFLSEDENRHTNPVNFYDSSTRLLYNQPMQYNTKQYEKRKDAIGKSHYNNNNEFQNMPMDFSRKNRISLEDLHTILAGVIFPQTLSPSQRFNITAADRDFVLKYMSSFPGESTFPSYDSSYNDAYGKFILYGAAQGKLPKNIRIFNKIGDAYGQMIDVAYVVDFSRNIEFMVSAAILCNTDGIMNDDKYDYNTIGMPFMKNLGQALYNYELKRKRTVVPDLTSFRFTYDK